MSQKTIFSFFNKKSTPAKNDSTANGSPKVLTPKQQSKTKVETPGKGKNAAPLETEVGDVVWAKLDGFPWWPSLVCNHPTTKSHIKTKPPQVHVQFFDDPPSRAWIKSKNIIAYKGSECPETKLGGQFYTKDEVCLGGMKEADQAIQLPREERLGLVVELLPSEDEEEDQMDFDADIFDTEMSENEGNSSKENHDVSGSKSPKKTPSKSPSKTGRPMRSARKAAKRRKVVGLDNEMEESDDEFKVGSDESGSDDDVSSGVDESEPETESDDPASPVKSLKRKRPGADGVKRSKGTPSRNQKTPRIQRRIASDSEEENDTPSPSAKNPSTPARDQNSSLNSSSFTPTVGQKTKSKLSAFAAKDLIAGSTADTEGRSFLHSKFDFLLPENIKDREGHSRDHPDYNPRTLYVSDNFLYKQTPGMKQWWELKSKHFDVVLFFKMGKFYELFHMDAVIGVKELGLVYMKGDHAHAGFPEIAFGRYADSLVEKGYKVARIEQTENPDMMNERVKKMLKPTKYDKVVRREICRVTSKATRVYSYIDGDISGAKDAYLLAICEKVEADSGCSTYGVCFVDTSTAKFQLGQFQDDRHHSRLRTLVSHYPPAQLLTERGKLSEASREVLTNLLSSALHDTLRSGGEFWESSRTLRSLAEDEYFVSEEEKEGEGARWPECLTKMKADSDPLGHTAAEEYELAVRALGAVIWSLKDSCIDHEILSMKNFTEYIPVDAAVVDKTAETCSLPGRRMVLDGVTLANLEILENNIGTSEGTLLARIDMCATNFGKRLLKHWLCAPLCHHDAINDRLDAIEDLMAIPDVAAEVREKLRKMPDLERLLSKIHTLGSATRSKEHPDGRAIFYEDVVYSKRKIEDFLSVLEGFKLAGKLLEKFEEPATSFKSTLLKNTVSLAENGGHFPDMTEQLKFFDKAFDHKEAREKGVIYPRDGVDPEYDQAIVDISRTKKELDKYLESQKKLLSCRTISYFGTAKNRYQLEIPDSVAKNVPHEYTVTSQKKGHKRYWTPEIEALLATLLEAEDHRDSALRDIMRRIFYTFDKGYQKWSAGVQCLSVLDVLLCLTDYSRCGEGVMCRPQMQPPQQDHKPYLEIREGRHPCIGRIFSGGDFIPNDTVVGIKDETSMEEDDTLNSDGSIVLVTGPNMGGKSTLMRQVGLITVLAQLGSYVPAEKCCLTPVDRVFTRLGANDRIMAGESTFFVELSETSSILQHASKHSLVLLDELGRGTATFDGTAIASAVIKELSDNVGCRTLFSTHYHSLVEDFATDANVRLGHMACMVENENDDDPSQETITFLYKFVSGACPKSYGFNAARLADLPEQVIQVAKKKAHELEHSQERLRWFRKLHRLGPDSAGVKELISAIA